MYRSVFLIFEAAGIGKFLLQEFSHSCCYREPIKILKQKLMKGYDLSQLPNFVYFSPTVFDIIEALLEIFLIMP